VFCDSHVHLSSARFAGELPEVMARAHSAGVTRMVTCGTDLASSEAEWAIARRYSGLGAAVGIHAHEASSAMCAAGRVALDEECFARLAALAWQPGVVAIGEIGLDYHYDLSPREAQRAVLARQLALAAMLDLPVILHNRESDGDLMRVVDAAPRRLRGVLHCFSAGPGVAGWALARGLYVGVAGPITFRNAGSLVDVIRSAPLDRLLIETDSPYLAPHPFRGQRNEPAHVVYVAERLAELLDLPVTEVAERTTANALRLFGMD